MGVGSVLYIAGSVVMTCSFLAVGISFFGPYWLSNVPATNEANVTGYPYLPGNRDVKLYPDRGLWAQCGVQCEWFWGGDRSYRLQKVFSNLKWHVATQVMYFIASAVLLFCEIINRVHGCCCYQNKRFLFIISVCVLFSALMQLASVATFGGGACRDPYDAIADPKKFTKYLGQAFVDSTGIGYNKTYLGWCYWMAVVGDMLTIASGVLFMLAACCCRPSKEDY
jgi:hypothetical protein